MTVSRAGAIYQRLLVSSVSEANCNNNMQHSRNLYTRYYMPQKPKTPYTWRSQRTFSTSRPGKEHFTHASTLKLALLGTTIGAGSGTAYSLYNSWKDKGSHKEHERVPPTRLKQFPENVRITKRYYNPADKSGLDIILFQFQTCPFCCKVRAYLDYKGISYSVVEVDAVLRQDIKWSEQKKVPMVLIKEKATNLTKSDEGQEEMANDYIQMYDSSAIISLLATYFNENKQTTKNKNLIELAEYYPTISYFDDDNKKKYDILNKYFLMFGEHGAPHNLSKDKEEDERKWRTWSDQLLVHLISPNCYQTLPEALETFEWFSEAGEWDIYFPRWERNLMVYAGAGAMWGIAKILKRRHQLTDDVRSHIYEALDNWSKDLQEKKTKFHGGLEPNLADLAVFGVLSSMEGCQAFKDIMANTEIGTWFHDVKQIVAKNRGQLIRERIVGENALTLIENSTA